MKTRAVVTVTFEVEINHEDCFEPESLLYGIQVTAATIDGLPVDKIVSETEVNRLTVID